MVDSFDAVRRLAAKVLCEYEGIVGHPSFTPEKGCYALLEDIAQKRYSLTVAPNFDFTPDILGELDLEYDTIGYHPDLDERRRRFVIAHEIGHRALEHPDRKVQDGQAEINEAPDQTSLRVQNGVYRSYHSKSQFELEANVFAAEFLAPVKLIRDHILTQPNWSVQGLTDYFGVSRTTILNQLVAALSPVVDEDAEEASTATATATTIQDDTHERAITSPSPALIEAGPGSGKTRVLVARYERLVKEDGVDPRKILALTFANKAAAEMRHRLAARMPDVEEKIYVTTFHSFGLDLLRRFGSALNYPPEIRLITPAEIILLLKPNLASMPMGRFENLTSPARDLGTLLDTIARAKAELTTPDELEAKARQWSAEIHALELPQDEDELEEAEKARELALKAIDAAVFYASYQKLLAQEGGLDFGDLVMMAVRLIQDTAAGPAIRAEYDHILVDEFQDINHASGELIRALDGGRRIVWAVGDIRQSIYQFNGAALTNMLRFRESYSTDNVIALGNNYRSYDAIVRCGALVPISDPLTGQPLPRLETVAARGAGGDKPGITLFNAGDKAAELEALLRTVQAERELVPKLSDIAILCRTRADAQCIATHLEEADIPTSWPGDLLSSAAFKDLVALLYVAAGDMRGFERIAQFRDFSIDFHERDTLIQYAKDNHCSTYELLKAIQQEMVEGLSEPTVQAMRRLSAAIEATFKEPTAFHVIAAFLFEGSTWSKDLFASTGPSARRSIAALRQLLSIARALPKTKGPHPSPVFDFLDFLETCFESDRLEAVTPELDDPRLVTVLTAHRSKGLEWPVVILPFLTQGKFPLPKQAALPIAPSVYSSGAPSDHAQEEACLFFVASTRARDRMYFSWAPYSRNQSKRSRFLDSIVDPLIEIGHLKTVDLPVPAKVAAAQAVAQSLSETFDYRTLNSYGKCPKRFEYENIMGLRGGDRGYPRFHSVVSECTRQLVANAKGGELGEFADATALLDALWEQRGPKGHWFESRYRERADAAVANLYERLKRKDIPELDRQFLLDANGVKVRLSVDEFVQGPPVRLRRYHYGRPAESHMGKSSSDDLPALLGAVAEQDYSGKPWFVEAYYPLLNEIRVTPMEPKMKNRLFKYRKDKVAGFARGLSNGVFDPKPNSRVCPECPFVGVCPAKTEDIVE